MCNSVNSAGYFSKKQLKDIYTLPSLILHENFSNYYVKVDFKTRYFKVDIKLEYFILLKEQILWPSDAKKGLI